jgi:hypothetical protein
MSNSKDNHSRRKFLSLGLMGCAGLLAGSAEAQTPIDGEEKVKMLTPDGQLVEVDRGVLGTSNQRHKASNKSILEWSRPVGK